MKTFYYLVALILSISVTIAQPDLILPSIFSDNMVLQRNSSVPFWGNGVPNKKIEFTSDWSTSTSTIVGEDSTWTLNVKTPDAGGPYTITIQSANSKIIYQNVLIGEVWLCSGQSNMEMPLAGWPPNDLIQNSDEEIKNAENENIRFFTVAHDISVIEKKDCKGEWTMSNPNSAASFSATAYFFGKRLYQELNIPIGLIHSSWGGTPAESWTSGDYLSKLPEFNSIQEEIEASIPASIKLNNWLNSFPRLQVRDIPGKNMWSGLDFNDKECSSAEFDDRNWSKMELPCLWESTELGEFDGAVWFRKRIALEPAWVNKEIILELGPIDDFDITFVNGKKVGAIEEAGNWQTPRKYTIPASVNNRKELVIAVRVNDTQGGGGIYGKPELLRLTNADGNSISLAGTWNYLPVAEYKGMEYYVFGIKDQPFKNRPKLPITLSPYTSTLLYNGMISPLVPYKIKGVIWYQGEANTGNPRLYERLFPTMINSWRDKFGAELPFYFVQIAPYDYGENTPSQYLRDAQRKTLVLDKTGMVVTLDIGNVNNIHPGNKKDVGERLANWALHDLYANNEIVCSGPIYKSMKIINDKIKIEFDHLGSGLKLIPGSNQWLIAGADKIFYPADAEIQNNGIVVSSPKVRNPFAVRYAWDNKSEATLFNIEGLPASSFRTDDWN